ncbi:ProQ/FINO family protein [Kistimonas scapharcae]
MDSGISETLKQDIEKLSGRSKAEIPKSEALRITREIWPHLFRISEPVPLKIGIHKEMIATNQVPPMLIKIALRYFVEQERYLESLKEGAIRIDSNGKRSGRVTLREAVGAEVALYRKQQRKLTGSTCDNREFIGRLRVVQ